VSYSETLFVSPLAFRCGSCGNVTELFDTAIHGYDAEIGGIQTNYRGVGKRAEFACDKCGPRQLHVFVRFEYPDDLFSPYCQEFRGREHEMFSWFSVIGNCEGCGRLLQVTDFECA
jgi:hypothetical protein